MPRVHSQRAARDYPEAGIKKGDLYYKWSFRYGGTRKSKTYPKRSQLTQSRAGEVYAELEVIEEAIGDADTGLPEIVEMCQSAAEMAREIGEEMQYNADEYFGGGGPQAELAEGYESWADNIENMASDLEGYERDDYDTADDFVEAWQETAYEITGSDLEH